MDQTDQDRTAAATRPAHFTAKGIGILTDVAGSASAARLDAGVLAALADHADPAIACAGQVGAQVKVRSGSRWLVANVRSVALAADGTLDARIDFLGEGDEAPFTGLITAFTRGITRYPVPGAAVHPVSTAELHCIYAADARPHVEIGTVHPTHDVRGALYVDALLGKHFALLGSTGTGKSTSAALILHRICDLAPQGHIVMVDPHGEYGAAFADTGELIDVGNLNLPYWLMNYEEHVEVFVTSHGADRQADSDVLAKCLLAARGKSRLGASIPKLTVDSPVPYLLSDLVQIIQTEMGRMDKAGGSAPYQRLKTRVDELRADPRYAFMFSGMLVGDSMAPFLSRIFRLPGEGRPISIIDVSGVPSDVTSVVVAVLSRMVFDFAIWSRAEPQRPILLVCEEAHRYIPSDRVAKESVVRSILER
ncbi:MAG: ATP-binding protein, partial [Sphingomonas sp.]